ncbi:LPP20 family lipoprotein [Neptunicella marina]
MRIINVCGVLMLSACSTVMDKNVEWEYVQPEHYPVLNAVGYAPISAQMGSSDAVKTLLAIKASKLDAYRELTEQVYGQRIEGSQELSNLVLSDEELKSSIQGVIRGAEVVKAYAADDDTYVTELRLDMQKVYDLYLSTARPKRIKKVNYY